MKSNHIEDSVGKEVNYRLRVLVINREGIHSFDENYVKEVLDITKSVFEKEFNKTIEFSDITWKDDDRSISLCKIMLEEISPHETIDLMLNGDVEKVVGVVKYGFADTFENIINVLPVNKRTGITNSDGLLEFLSTEYVSRRDRLFDEVIDEQHLYANKEQTLAWCFDKYIEKEKESYDLIFTNNLLFVAEDNDAYRIMYYGGMESGHAPFMFEHPSHAMAIVSIFPYANNKSKFLSDTYFAHLDKEDIKRELAIITSHELGHSILREEHVYNDWNCIMNHNYVDDLSLKEWKLFFEKIGTCKEKQNLNYYDLKYISYLFKNERYQEAYDAAQKRIDSEPALKDDELWFLLFYQMYSLDVMGRYSGCIDIGKKYGETGDRLISKESAESLEQMYNRCLVDDFQNDLSTEEYQQAHNKVVNMLKFMNYMSSEEYLYLKEMEVHTLFFLERYMECYDLGSEVIKGEMEAGINPDEVLLSTYEDCRKYSGVINK